MAQIYRLLGKSNISPFLIFTATSSALMPQTAGAFKNGISANAFANCFCKSLSATIGYSEKPSSPRSSNWNKSPNICAQFPRLISSIIRYTPSAVLLSSALANCFHALIYACKKACSTNSYTMRSSVIGFPSASFTSTAFSP